MRSSHQACYAKSLPDGRLFVLCAVFATVATVSASAELIPYFGGPDESKLSLNAASATRTAFLATLDSYGSEDVESRSGANPTLAFGTTGITAATGFSNGVNTQFAYSVSGLKFLWDADGVDDWLEFSEPVTAFGSYIVQGGDGSSAPPTSTPPNTLTFRLENTITSTSKEVSIQTLGPDWPFYNVIFVGVTDTEPFNRISFHESYDHDGLLWDDLIAGHVAAAPRPGDFDHNDMIDEADLPVWQDHYGETGNGPYMLGDGDGDGDADGRDFLVWQRQFGAEDLEATGAVSSKVVPEPGTFLLMLLSVVAGGIRRA